MVLERLCLRFNGIPGSLSQSDAPSLSEDLSGKVKKNAINILFPVILLLIHVFVCKNNKNSLKTHNLFVKKEKKRI